MKSLLTLTLFLFSSMFIIIPSSYCMDLIHYKCEFPPLIYPVCVISSDDETEVFRYRFEPCSFDQVPALLDKLPILSRNIECITKLDYHENNYECFQFAMGMITGNSKLSRKIKFPGYRGSIPLKKFFKQVEKPQEGDIAMYEREHVAYVMDENCFLSKWGRYPHIFKHFPGYIPKDYGDFYIILRLVEKYQNDIKLLVKDIKKNLRNEYR